MPTDRPGKGAAAFDTFRRELIRKCVPVQKTARTEWEARIKEFVEAALPEPRKLFQKPGLAARMFAVEIEVPQSHPRDLEVFAQQLDLVWEAKLPKEIAEWRTLTTPDRNDVIWEFAVDVGGSYVTGCVKLRNYPFERAERRDDRSSEDRPRRPYQRRDDRPSDDRPRRPYQRRDDRPTGDRPSRPYQRRDDRPSGDRPPRPYQKRADRPSGPSDRPKRPYQRRDDRPSRPGDRPRGPYKRRDEGGGGRPYKRRPKD